MNAQLAMVREPQRDNFFTEDDIRLIRQTVARDANDQEFAYFIRVAALRGLNPLLGQIRLTIYDKTDATKRQATIITTIHGLRLIAARTGRYAPGSNPSWKEDDKGNPIAATAYVRVYHPKSNTWHEYSDTAFMKEYNTNKNLWVKMPHLMLAKVAEALALRRGFPEQLTGIYTDDEMGQASMPAQTVNAHTGEIIDMPARILPEPEAPRQPAPPSAVQRDEPSASGNGNGHTTELPVTQAATQPSPSTRVLRHAADATDAANDMLVAKGYKAHYTGDNQGKMIHAARAYKIATGEGLPQGKSTNWEAVRDVLYGYAAEQQQAKQSPQSATVPDYEPQEGELEVETF